MTIQASTPRFTWAGDGVSTVFPVNIQGYQASDFLAETLVVSSGLLTELTLNSNYTMLSSGSLAPPYWTLTLSAPLPIGTNLSVVIDPIAVQQSQYVSGQAFSSQAIQTNLDRLTQMIIRLQDQISRVVQFPDIDTASGVLPAAALRASMYLATDGSGNVITTAALPGTANTQASLGPILYPKTALEVAAAVTPSYYYIPSYNAWAYVGRYANSLATAVAVAASTQFTAYIDQPITVAANLTVPVNVTLEFVGNGQISVSGGATLTVNGPVIGSSTQAQLFTGTGTLVFGTGAAQFLIGELSGQSLSLSGSQTIAGSLTLGGATGGSGGNGVVNATGYELNGVSIFQPAALLNTLLPPTAVNSTAASALCTTSTTVPPGFYAIEIMVPFFGNTTGTQGIYFKIGGTAVWTTGDGDNVLGLLLASGVVNGAAYNKIWNPGTSVSPLTLVLGTIVVGSSSPDAVIIKGAITVTNGGTLSIQAGLNSATNSDSVPNGAYITLTPLP